MRLLRTADRGEWLRARVGEWATVGGVAGTGFEAYARILHPVDARQVDLGAADGQRIRSVIAEAPFLRWPGRDYLLFETSLGELADPAWSEDAGLAGVMPQLLWPADHAWVMASEIDWDSTIVAGSRTLVEEILASEAWESFEVTEDADLTWDGDTVNPLPQGRMGG